MPILSLQAQKQAQEQIKQIFQVTREQKKQLDESFEKPAFEPLTFNANENGISKEDTAHKTPSIKNSPIKKKKRYPKTLRELKKKIAAGKSMKITELRPIPKTPTEAIKNSSFA